MKKLNQKILALLISVIIAGVFLYFVLIPPSAFNFIPFAIHQFMFQEIIEEHIFVIVFDVIIAGLILGLVFRFIDRKIMG